MLPISQLGRDWPVASRSAAGVLRDMCLWEGLSGVSGYDSKKIHTPHPVQVCSEADRKISLWLQQDQNFDAIPLSVYSILLSYETWLKTSLQATMASSQELLGSAACKIRGQQKHWETYPPGQNVTSKAVIPTTMRQGLCCRFSIGVVLLTSTRLHLVERPAWRSSQTQPWAPAFCHQAAHLAWWLCELLISWISYSHHDYSNIPRKQVIKANCIYFSYFFLWNVWWSEVLKPIYCPILSHANR